MMRNRLVPRKSSPGLIAEIVTLSRGADCTRLRGDDRHDCLGQLSPRLEEIVVGPWEDRETRPESRGETLGLGHVAELVVVADEDGEPPLEGGTVVLHEVEDPDGGSHQGDA